MKATIFRYGPYVVGGVLGWLLASPPAWLGEDLRVRGLLAFLLVAVFFLGFLLTVVAASLPAEVGLTSKLGQAAPREIHREIEAFLRLGFSLAGPPLEVAMSPPALLVPFIDAPGTTYGVVARLSTVPARTVVDCVSLFDDDRGGLTTTPKKDAAMLPTTKGGLRQVIIDAGPDVLYEEHQRALAYLSRKGLRIRRLEPEGFGPALRRGVARQRAAFFRSPIRNALVTLWRIVTRQIPEEGPIERQKAAQQKIAWLLSGRTE